WITASYNPSLHDALPSYDVVTHHVSVIVIQAGAAERALERRPADARQAVAAIAATGRQALADMRTMLGILGPPRGGTDAVADARSEEHTSELQSREKIVC